MALSDSAAGGWAPMTAQNYDVGLLCLELRSNSSARFIVISDGAGKMPNWLLADFQIDEIVAYILSLKDGRASNTF